MRKGLKGLKPGQTAVLNPLKNRWQGLVAVRVVALEACCPLKKRWQGHVAVRVFALERPAGGFEGFEAGQTAVLNPLKNRWQGHVGVSKSCCLGKACGRVWRV